MVIEKLEEFAKDGQKNTDGLTPTDGFPVLTKPARQWFNWLFNTLTIKINEIIDEKIYYEDIIDNLTTNDSLKPVSAKQAKALKDSITAIEDIVLYAPIAWPSTTIPSGHLAMMGQTISQAQYPKLYALYGSKLPDMRAYSIKGLDYGRGIDSGRSILTEQGDAIRNISGHITPAASPDQNASWVHVSTYSGVFYPTQSGGGAALTGVVGGTGNMGISMDVSRQVPTATENRVKNIAFLYIVKAG